MITHQVDNSINNWDIRIKKLNSRELFIIENDDVVMIPQPFGKQKKGNKKQFQFSSLFS